MTPPSRREAVSRAHSGWFAASAVHRGAERLPQEWEIMIGETEFVARFDAWTDRFATFVGVKGKVEPSRYRAFGYHAPRAR
jgi:hypothetical protein